MPEIDHSTSGLVRELEQRAAELSEGSKRLIVELNAVRAQRDALVSIFQATTGVQVASPSDTQLIAAATEMPTIPAMGRASKTKTSEVSPKPEKRLARKARTRKKKTG